MIYNDPALNEFVEKYARDLVLCCYGDEAIYYAEEFEFNEYHITKYQNNILENIDLISNRNVLDIGSNTGIWPVLMYLNGATSVTCIEPRKQFVIGINKFAKLHNLPIQCIHGFHDCIFELEQTFDTTVMMGVDDLIPDIVKFMGQLKRVSDFLILKTKDSDDLTNKNTIKININNHNLDLRAGFQIDTDLNECEDPGYQTTIEKFITDPHCGAFIKFQYGSEFYDTLFAYLNYQILRFYRRDTSDNIFFKFYAVKLS